MDIIDILVARAKSFTGETAKLTKQAQDAMAAANEVAGIINDAQDSLEAAQAAETAWEGLSDELAAITSAANNAEYLAETANTNASDALAAVNDLSSGVITEAEIEDDNGSGYKGKKLRTRKNLIDRVSNIFKNYTSKGQHEDGSMTQKAITDELNSLSNRINNIPTGGSGSSSGNISGNITSEDAGSLVVVGEDGNITASTIKEGDLIATQIAAGSYHNDNIVGLEIDYVNKTFTRLQGAAGLNAGSDFDKFTIYGGRKRCIVQNSGEITRFVTSEDTLETLRNKRIMVYQPAVYYLRLILGTTETANGTKVTKEQIYLADQPYGGFKLHPLFHDDIGDPVKAVLIPAFESGTLRSGGSWELNDSQDLNLAQDKLVSVVSAKPISGVSQAFTYDAANTMAENNGSGWELTDLRFESLQQMLMMVEYGTTNIQSVLNLGVSSKPSGSGNSAVTTGSTLSLLNASGKAASTDGETAEGYCSISYRGMENPYGNIWRFIGGVKVENYILKYNNQPLSFKLPQSADWVNGFGYDSNFDWVYLPIETGNGANSSLPIGDYIYPPENSSTVTSGIIGGMWNSNSNNGPFYYSFNLALEGYHYRSDSARVMYTPVANSATESRNYNKWLEE